MNRRVAAYGIASGLLFVGAGCAAESGIKATGQATAATFEDPDFQASLRDGYMRAEAVTYEPSQEVADARSDAAFRLVGGGVLLLLSVGTSAATVRAYRRSNKNLASPDAIPIIA